MMCVESPVQISAHSRPTGFRWFPSFLLPGRVQRDWRTAGFDGPFAVVSLCQVARGLQVFGLPITGKRELLVMYR